MKQAPGPLSTPTGGGPYEGADEDVKRWILQHSDVVEDGWNGAGTVLPVSFNVIARADLDKGTSADAQLRAWLDSASEKLTGRLAELAGTSELRVEISLDRTQFVSQSEEVRRIKDEMETRPPGVRRLLEKRLEKTEKELTDSAADQLYPNYRARIAQHCIEIEEYRKPARESGLVPVLTASCLLKTDRTQELGAELSAIQDEQASANIRFLGPWPPYSFAEMVDNEESLQGPTPR